MTDGLGDIVQSCSFQKAQESSSDRGYDVIIDVPSNEGRKGKDYETKKSGFPKIKGMFSNLGKYLRRAALFGTAIAVLGFAACANPLQPPIPKPSQNTENVAPVGTLSFTPPSGNAPYSGEADGTATDANGDPITYVLYMNGNKVVGAQQKPISYSVNNLSEGSYKFKLVVSDPSGASDTVNKTLNVGAAPTPPPTPGAPQVDLTTIVNNDTYNSSPNSPNVDEETQSVIQLPLTTTTGDSVTYTSASSANGNVILDTSQLSSGKLGIKGNSTTTNEDYSVTLSFKDNTTSQTGTATLSGINYNHPNVEFTSVQAVATHYPHNGDFRFYAVWKDASKNTLTSPNGVAMGPVGIESADAGTIQDGSTGSMNQLYLPASETVNAQLSARETDLSSLITEAWATTNSTSGDQLSWVRTVDNLPAGGFVYTAQPRMNPAIRVGLYKGKYPVPDYDGDGVVGGSDLQLFKQYMLQVSSLLGKLVKFEDPNTEIVQGDPSDSSVTFSPSDISSEESTLQYWSDVISGAADGGPKIRNGFNSPILTPGNVPVYWNPSTGDFSALGWSVVMPGDTGNVGSGHDGLTGGWSGAGEPYTVGNAWSYLVPPVYSAQAGHETALQKVFSGETTVLGPTQSIMNADTSLSSPAVSDKKGAMEVNEETYLNGNPENNLFGSAPN